MVIYICRVIDEIDAVLLSHCDTLHLGLIPRLIGRLGLTAPVYATAPIHKMGQMFLYDYYLSRQDYDDFTDFTLDDVDAAFSRFMLLKYSQQVVMSVESLTSKGYLKASDRRRLAAFLGDMT